MNGSKILLKDFDNHRLVTFIYDPQSKLQGFIAIHRGNGSNVPSFGATRFVSYNTLTDGLHDALRLSRLMSYKAAMAGLKYGGAKGVILIPQVPHNKKQILQAYCKKINYLNGHFITGADVGINGSEVGTMRKYSNFIVGVKVDPVKYTVLGILYGLQVSLQEVFGNSDIQEKTFSILGVGKIGTGILKSIYGQAKKIYISDIDQQQIKKIKHAFPKITILSPQEIFKQKVNVFMPCALGNALNTKTISKLRSDIILGGANNQLTNSTVGELLFKLGILYAPDYVVNAGGLISVVDEYENKNIVETRIEKRLSNIKTALRSIFKQSMATGIATNMVADKMAEKIFNNH